MPPQPNSKPSTPLPDLLVPSLPLYQQLARLFRDQIHQGLLKPGDRFPSERDLAHRYSISRITANKVISCLTAENLLQLRPGIGAFVTSGKALHTSLRDMESFTAHARAEGFEPATQVLQFFSLPAADAPPAVHLGLQLASDSQEPLIFCERLRLADDEPVILEHRWIRSQFVPGLCSADLEASFYTLLRNKFQLLMQGERHSIQARNASAAEAVTLRIKRGAALLVVEGPGFIQEKTPLWYQVLLYRGDRYQLSNEVFSERPNSTVVALRARAA